MPRPCPELAFEVAAKECRLAGRRGEPVIDVLPAPIGLGVYLVTDTDHDWGIAIIAWKEDVPCKR